MLRSALSVSVTTASTTPATTAVIAGRVGYVSGVLVNRKLVNSWHHRGLIRKVDDDPDSGDPRFREALDRAAKSKPRKAG